MKSARVMSAIVGVAALGLTACSGSSQPSETTSGGRLVDGKTFTMAIATDPGNLDPLFTQSTVTRQVDRFLYGRLINLSPEGKAISGLAEKWQASTTRASFRLRPGITCSDGSPVTASDVAANINFVGDPENKSPLTGQQVMPGTKVRADDAARTVTVTSGAPDAFLLLNIGTLPIVCGKGLTNRSLLAKGKAGTGMFTISDAVPNDHYTLTRRKDFTWGPGNWKVSQPGLPDKVVVKVIPNETTATNLLLSDQLNAATINGPDQDRLHAQQFFHADVHASFGQFFFNQAKSRPGQDETVRRALVQALNLDQLGKVLTHGKGKPAKGMVTFAPKPCSGDTAGGDLPGRDLSAANSALDAAGWTVGSDGARAKDGETLSLTVLFSTSGGQTVAAAAELVRTFWKNIGVTVTIKGVDSTGLDQALFSTGAWDVWMGPLGLGLPTVLVPLVSGPAPPQGRNFAHIQNEQYEAQVQKASTMAGATGCPHWNAAETALIKAVDVVPYTDIMKPAFGKGATFHVDDGIDPASIRMRAS